MNSLDLNNTPLVLLDDSRPTHKANSSFLFHSPEFLITAHDFDEIEPALKALDQAISDGLHVAGWIAYECAHAFEPRLAEVITRKAEEPLIWMMATRSREHLTSQDMAPLFHTSNRGNHRLSALEKRPPSQNEQEYSKALETVQAYITAGDVYQINHTLPMPINLSGNALTMYRRLRQSQPVAYGAFIDTGTHKILSLSPELFLKKTGQILTAQPMKGTAARGKTYGEDLSTQAFLAKDIKSQAENLMIVDLIRNDLSRVSEAGSVKVPTLFNVEQYPTLHQMTSTVTAEARAGLKPSELIAAMFPCGSVTGAPKIRAMEIIQSLESSPRGVYCGTIGYFSPKTANAPENWCLNVPIRTLIVNTKGEGRISVGSGVVADSDPAKEYQECLLKSAFTDSYTPEFSLIETMKLEQGTVSYLPRHLERLGKSATYFDFSFDPQKAADTIVDHITAIEGEPAIRRLRLLLDARGNISITSTEAPSNQLALSTVCLSAVRTDSGDPFLFHKTTHRDLYNKAAKAAHEMGHADILFLNTHGDVTEGAISTIFVEKSGTLHTPPIEAGVLPGVLRSELLETHPNIKITPLRHEDLLKADTLYIGSAFRGLRIVKLVHKEWQPTE